MNLGVLSIFDTPFMKNENKELEVRSQNSRERPTILLKIMSKMSVAGRIGASRLFFRAHVRI